MISSQRELLDLPVVVNAGPQCLYRDGHVLPAVDDRLDDVRREECQAQYAGQVGRRDAFVPGQIGDGGEVA